MNASSTAGMVHLPDAIGADDLQAMKMSIPSLLKGLALAYAAFFSRLSYGRNNLTGSL